MKPGSISAFLLAVTGVAVFAVSRDIMGTGFWGAAILGFSALVAASPYVPVLLLVARPIAALASILSILAVLLGLLAATTGGSFRLPSDQSLLLALLFFLAVFGLIFARTKVPPPANAPTDDQTE